MELKKGSPCFCGSEKDIENCCINFDAKISVEDQVRLRNKYKNIRADEDIRLLGEGINGTTTIIHGELSEKDTLKSDRTNELINEYHRMKIMHGIFEYDYYELTSYAKGQNNSNDNQINRLVINFISNAKLFIDFLENYVKNNYSSKFNGWKKLQSSFFDNHYEYSLMYHLRNHVQHVGLPIRHIEKHLVDDNGTDRIMAEYFLEKSNLSDDKKLHKKVKEFIKNLPMEVKRISIMPIVYEYSGMVEGLYMMALTFYVDKNINELNNIREYFESRNLVKQLLYLYVNKEKYINGDLEGARIMSITTSVQISEMMLELGQMGAIKINYVE